MKSLYHKILRLKAIVSDHRKNKYLSYKEALSNWVKNHSLDYQFIALEKLKTQKKTDTIFILGNGPSLNQLSKKNIEEILHHDSFGVSYSFLKKEIIPTYHLFSWENDLKNEWSALQTLIDNFASFRETYQNTIIFLNTKAIFRLAHPKICPLFFPESPKCCIFNQTNSLKIGENQKFKDEDFEQTLSYRGTLSVVLDLAYKLDYKKIIILGVDPDKWEYFYQKYDFMEEILRRTYELSYGIGNVKDINKKYVGMYPRTGKAKTMDEYLYACADFLKRKKSCELFVGFKDNMLYPKLPAYFD